MEKEIINDFNIKDYGAIGDGTHHPVSEWLKNGPLDKGYENLKDIQKDYPMVLSLDDSIDWVVYEHVKQIVPHQATPIKIYIPTGTYVINSSGKSENSDRTFSANRNNIYVYGDGMNNTKFVSIGALNSEGLSLNYPVKRAGQYWKPNEIDRFDVSEPTIGKNWLRLIDPRRAEYYYEGMLVLIRYGASYFDQDYGEYNKVKKVEDGIVYFEKTISRNYLPSSSPYHGEITKEVIVPEIGESFYVNFSVNFNANLNKTITIDKYNFEVIENQGNGNYLLLNSEVDPNTIISKGAKVYKAYGIMRFKNNNGGNGNGNQVHENITIEGIEFKGSTRGAVVNNVYNVTLKECRFIRDSRLGNSSRGLSYEMDLSRGVKVYNCEFVSDEFKGSQISRSSGDISFDNCKFYNCSVDFTEFNFNCVVNNCHFEIDALDDIKANTAAIGIGATCTGIKVLNNHIYTNGINAGIGNSDIQEAPHNTNNGNLISNNYFYLRDSSIGIIGCGGNTLISNNIINGDFRIAISNSTRNEKSAGFQGMNIFDNNIFSSTRFMQVAFMSSNFIIKNNIFKNLGNEFNTPFGNIINNHGSSSPNPANFELSNNRFYNWYLQPFSVNLNNPDKNLNLSNNHFIDCMNTEENNFILDFNEFLSPPKIITATKDVNSEFSYWISNVSKEGGKITNYDKFLTNKIISDIYKYGLRDKIIRLNLFIGDAKASLVPQLGYGYPLNNPPIYRDKLINLNEENFNPKLGWIPKENSKIEIIDSSLMDFNSMGFAIQATSSLEGNDEMILQSQSNLISISKHRNGNLVTINSDRGGKAGKINKGFLYSGNESDERCLDYIFTNDEELIFTNKSNKGYHTLNNFSRRGNIKLFGNEGKRGTTSSIGGYAITTFLDEKEAQILSKIFHGTMEFLGRPV